MKLALDIMEILRNHLQIDPAAQTITITKRLDEDQKLYAAVAKVLTDLGGVYKTTGKRQGKFRYPYDPSDLIGAVLQTGEVNPGAFFPTPRNIAQEMMETKMGEYIEYSHPTDMALEPSAGQGVLVQALLDAGWKGKIAAVEDDPTNLAFLRRRFWESDQVIVVDSTFEAYDGAHGPFWVVVMNPPFTIKSQTTTYIKHINRAFGMLRQSGILRSIAPTNWRVNNNKAFIDFAAFVTRHGESDDLPKGSFVESGVNTDTCLVTLTNDASDPRDQESDGYPNYWLKYIDMHATCERSFDVARQNIWQRLDSGKLVNDFVGRPQLEEVALNLYRPILENLRREQGWCYILKPDDITFLVDHFVDRYEENRESIKNNE